jgi:esterase/lipase superfamily enzyme
MVTDKYINENKTETFKKGDKVIMHSCHESTFEEYKDKVWICATSSFLDKAKQDVVFLEDFSGAFFTKFLQIKSS